MASSQRRHWIIESPISFHICAIRLSNVCGVKCNVRRGVSGWIVRTQAITVIPGVVPGQRLYMSCQVWLGVSGCDRRED